MIAPAKLHHVRGHDQILSPSGPLSVLEDGEFHLSNAPYAATLVDAAKRYRDALHVNVDELNFAIVYARGARFYSIRATIEREVEAGEWPELNPIQREALESICSLHGPLVLASAVGRKIVADAHEFEATPDVNKAEERLYREFGIVLAGEGEIFERETSEQILDLTMPVADDPQPARTRRLRFLIATSALVTIVGGVAWLQAGGGVLVASLPAVGVGAFLWEAVKKTGHFNNATATLARSADASLDQIEVQANISHTLLLERMATLVAKQRKIFHKIAKSRPEFEWAKKYIGDDDVDDFNGTLRRL